MNRFMPVHPGNYKFNVVAGGLKVQELFADAVARGIGQLQAD